MSIKLEAVVSGAVFYGRHRHKMGSTTTSTLGEWSVRVVEGYDAAKGYAMCSWNGNRPSRYYPRQLKALFDWSMHNKDEAEMVRGMFGSVVKVTRRKKCTTCKTRHASAQCPKEEP